MTLVRRRSQARRCKCRNDDRVLGTLLPWKEALLGNLLRLRKLAQLCLIISLTLICSCNNSVSMAPRGSSSLTRIPGSKRSRTRWHLALGSSSKPDRPSLTVKTSHKTSFVFSVNRNTTEALESRLFAEHRTPAGRRATRRAGGWSPRTEIYAIRARAVTQPVSSERKA